MFEQFYADIRVAHEHMYDFIGGDEAKRRSNKKLELIHSVLCHYSGGSDIEVQKVPSFGSTEFFNVDYSNKNNPNEIYLYGLVKAPTQDIKSNQYNLQNTITGEVGRCFTFDPNIKQIIHHTCFIPRELKGKKGKIEQIEKLNFDLGKSDLLQSIASSNKWFCDIIYYDNSSSLNFDIEQMKKLYQRCCWIAKQLAI